MGYFGLDAVSFDRSHCDRAAGKSEQYSVDTARPGYARCGKSHGCDDVSRQLVACSRDHVDGVGSAEGNSDGDGHDVSGRHILNVDCAAWSSEAHTFGFQWAVLSRVCSVHSLLVAQGGPSTSGEEKNVPSIGRCYSATSFERLEALNGACSGRMLGI